MIDSVLEDRRGTVSEAVNGFSLTFYSHDVAVELLQWCKKVCRPNRSGIQ